MPWVYGFCVVHTAFGYTPPVISDMYTVQKEYFAIFYTPLKLIISKIWHIDMRKYSIICCNSALQMAVFLTNRQIRNGRPIMHTLITISLAVNIVVLIPIVILMLIKSPLVDHAWGTFTAARGILLSMYGTILVMSCALIVMPIPAFVAALLLVQVIYKITTPFTVGSITNPIVISNLLVAAFHGATLLSIYSAIGDTLVAIG